MYRGIRNQNGAAFCSTMKYCLLCTYMVRSEFILQQDDLKYKSKLYQNYPREIKVVSLKTVWPKSLQT